MEERIRIDAMQISPNPVFAGQQFVVRVDVAEIIPGIITSSGNYIATSEGAAIERVE